MFGRKYFKIEKSYIINSLFKVHPRIINFDLLNKKGVEIQARSVFLQGLAFLTPDELPPALGKARPQLEDLHAKAAELGIPIEALCLNFVLANRYIDKVIIGVDSLAQLKDNVAGLAAQDKVGKMYEDLKRIRIEREEILLPYKWKK